MIASQSRLQKADAFFETVTSVDTAAILSGDQIGTS